MTADGNDSFQVLFDKLEPSEQQTIKKLLVRIIDEPIYYLVCLLVCG